MIPGVPYKTAYTSANLDGIRCIRFSSGLEGRSRHSDHISGIWLDYYDSSEPAIVGQWISPTADVFELQRDELLTEVSVWLINDAISQEGRAKLGKIIGISLKTSKMRSKRVESTPTDGAFRLDFRANRFENLVYNPFL